MYRCRLEPRAPCPLRPETHLTSCRPQELCLIRHHRAALLYHITSPVCSFDLAAYLVGQRNFSLPSAPPPSHETCFAARVAPLDAPTVNCATGSLRINLGLQRHLLRSCLDIPHYFRKASCTTTNRQARRKARKRVGPARHGVDDRQRRIIQRHWRMIVLVCDDRRFRQQRIQITAPPGQVVTRPMPGHSRPRKDCLNPRADAGSCFRLVLPDRLQHPQHILHLQISD